MKSNLPFLPSIRALLCACVLGGSAHAGDKPLSAEDQLAIQQLVAGYAQSLDGGDADAYADKFVPDGVVEWANGRMAGREKIRAWVKGLMKGGIGATPAQVRHFVNMPYIKASSDGRATAHTYVVIFGLNKAGNVNVPSVSSYEDTLVKVNGQWLFQKRILTADLGVFGRRDD
jgi:uncharacterized protein (TIGR02246 family)